MPDVFEVLSRDHREVQQMLSDLESGPTAAAGATADQLAQRKRMSQALIIEESKHEAAEQMHFWPIVRARMPNGALVADHAIGQEREGKDIFHKLDKANPADSEFEALLGEFIAAGRDHIAYEEGHVWPKLRTALSAAEAAELGTRIEQAKKTAPTRPNPHTPASPAALKSTGPVVAAADKARDKVTGCGR
jgi:hypothetical protein